jgi:hypothetical protein
VARSLFGTNSQEPFGYMKSLLWTLRTYLRLGGAFFGFQGDFLGSGWFRGTFVENQNLPMTPHK